MLLWQLSPLWATSLPFLASTQPLECFLIAVFTRTLWRLLKRPDKPPKSKARRCPRGRDQREPITWAGGLGSTAPAGPTQPPTGTRVPTRRPPPPPRQPQPADAIADHRQVSTLGQERIHKVSEHLKNETSDKPHPEAEGWVPVWHRPRAVPFPERQPVPSVCLWVPNALGASSGSRAVTRSRLGTPPAVTGQTKARGH